MFTGIVTDVGEVLAREPLGDGARFTLRCAYDPATIAIGASVACAGCCLTVTTVEPDGPGARFSVDASTESLALTTLGRWREGTRVNLERSLRAGDELGGHLVSGHVDARAQIAERADGDDMTMFRFRVPEALAPLIAHKGSVALDGTSLTVIEPQETFAVAMIPHTLAVTTWGERQAGDEVNIEVDTIARYVARLVEARQPSAGS